MVHYKATIEYDGTDFRGFQRQPEARTVQGVLEETLARLQGGAAASVRGAGRTDSGVHATGQVIDFRLPWRKSDTALLRALNGTLPADVAVRSLQRAHEGFHPRYEALSRAYIYTLLNSPHRLPLFRRVALHEPRPLDAEAMHEAVAALRGEHDFASFGRPTTESESTTRTLLDARVWREGDFVLVRLEANGFLYRMVRSIVGTLLPVGRGERPPGWVAEVLAARDRGEAAAVIPPQGLCLVAVQYPESSVLDHPIP